MRQSDKEIDVVNGTDKEREEYIDKCIDYLLRSLDSVQWVSLAHIRNELAPISLQDKEQLLKRLIINPRKKMESKTYIEWLNKQKDRNDSLGDLVRKFLTDENIKSWYGFRDNLERLGATEDEIKTCEHSWVEYTTQRYLE